MGKKPWLTREKREEERMSTTKKNTHTQKKLLLPRTRGTPHTNHQTFYSCVTGKPKRKKIIFVLHVMAPAPLPNFFLNDNTHREKEETTLLFFKTKIPCPRFSSKNTFSLTRLLKERGFSKHTKKTCTAKKKIILATPYK